MAKKITTPATTIPKRFITFSDSALTGAETSVLNYAKRMNPDWDFDHWTPDRVEQSPNCPRVWHQEKQRNHRNAASRWAALADAVRVWQLLDGGVWLDTDMLLGDISGYVAGKAEFIATHFVARRELINCIMGAEPNSEFFAAVFEAMKGAQYSMANVSEFARRVGTPLIEQVLCGRQWDGEASSLVFPDVVQAEVEDFCPYSIVTRRAGQLPDMTKFKLGMHLFSNSWFNEGTTLSFERIVEHAMANLPE